MWRSSLKVNDPAPTFDLLDEEGKRHALTDHKGRWLAMFFYPRDMTPLCVKEACAFNDRWEEFRDLGADVLGCSGQDASSHTKMRMVCRLRYHLLCDVDGSMHKAWGVSRLLHGRVTYVVDPSGSIRFVFKRRLQGEAHAARALEFLKKNSVGAQ